ncbi:MAG: ergothioneine biosynthesis protein EgtB [Pseudomonadota bacterium]
MDLEQRFAEVRADSERFCTPLHREDYSLQAMADTSPPKWHLAHTSWFFETFVLKPYQPEFQAFNPAFEVLFNSYYNGIGDQHPRPERGLLSRPALEEVLDYREHVNTSIHSLLRSEHAEQDTIRSLVELGTHHEQQHQELFFTDIKYSLSRNPIAPAYLEQAVPLEPDAHSMGWLEHSGGKSVVGHQVGGFCFDNELPAHEVLLQPFALADRLVTNAEYQAFIDDGGYQSPEYWLSDGWATVSKQDWQAPLYWRHIDGAWQEYSLYGLIPLDPNRPVSHVSGYEADAYARWAGHRLPSEFEWEIMAREHPLQGQFVDEGLLHPASAGGAEHQLHGGLWEWTSSAYTPYPGFQTAAGAVGEYNGKFMANQWVLRGGSCVTSRSQLRSSYRNFFYPPDRWQFTGIRLASWR